MKAGRSVPPVAASPQTKSLEVPLRDIQPEEHNRPIDETDEEFLELVDSVRVLGVLSRVHVRASTDGRFVLVDGERRWRASLKAGRETIPCEVWPEDSHPRDAKLAGVILNEQRKAHGSLHVARRLRQIKNEFGETQEDLAARTGIALARVKSYLALFGASDCLLDFFANQDMPLRVACEFMRYEKAVGEAPARRLAKEYAESPMSFRELARLRKRHEARAAERKTLADDATDPGNTRALRSSPRRLRFGDRLEAAFQADREAALRELEEVARRLGIAITVRPVGP